MLQVDDALKRLYKTDSTDKNLILDFYRRGQPEPFLRIWESNKILFESMEIDESLSSSKNLDFGSCEASQMKVTLIGVEDDIKDAEMTVYQTLEGQYPSDSQCPGSDMYPSGYTMPLGRYIVQSAERQGKNREYRDVVALDFMRAFDVDVIDWYNALPFPLPLREFRARLCRHIGVAEHVPEYLPNDSMLVEKTINAAQLMGREVLIACEQVNGVFGHFDRNGILQHIALQSNYSLSPAVDLYPSLDLYPVLPGEMNDQVYDEQITRSLYKTCQFEEYTVKSIDKVQIRQEEGDIGAIYGTGENTLTVEGNFLLFGMSASDLNIIAQGIYGLVNGRQYIPYECSMKGLPYVEVGDTELIEADRGDIVTYVIKRTLKGIYALKDTHSATGEEIRRTENNINTEITKLRGKAAFLTKTVDEVSVRMTDLEKNTEAQLAITAEQISAEVKRAQEAEASLSIRADNISLSVEDLQKNVEAQLRVTAEQIALKVTKGEVSSQLSVEAGGVSIVGDRFSWSSTYSSMTADGKFRCVDGEFSGYVKSTSGQIGGFLIEGNSLRSNGDSSIDFGNVTIDNTGLLAGNWAFSDSDISCMAGIIANDDGNVFVHNSRYYNGWTVARALDDLRNRIGGGGGCGSDGCPNDTCDDEGCNDDTLIDDIGGCG